MGLLPELEHYRKTQFPRALGKLKGRKDIIVAFSGVRKGFMKSDSAVQKTKEVRPIWHARPSFTHCPAS